ncbi:MAG: DNA-protecting protein DprA [Flavobacteriaceae bacterium]|nr:DNA-protecting protein DprA [Flavobacteriaceae bacterium]
MLSNNELLHVLALQRVPNLGDSSAKKLIHVVGSAEGVFNERKSNLLRIEGIGSWKLQDLDLKPLLPQVEEELKFIQDQEIAWSYFLDKDYPELLKHCLDGPILFFRKGNIDLVGKRVISIVGTRRLTTAGMQFCEQLVEELKPFNPVIVSGFAHGADICAQKAAIRNGLQTIGCLAHGLNQIYPREHEKYIGPVVQNGGFITEFWSDDPFERTNFLKRNRIIAGLSEATIVIESAAKGGSLVTADIANSYNREVFAVPGRPSNKQSRGCNDLIKNHKACLLQSADDLVFQLGWEQENAPLANRQTELFVTLSEEEKTIWKFLESRELEQLDQIALECKLPTFKVASLLLSLEIKGYVRPLPGKLFQLV